MDYENAARGIVNTIKTGNKEKIAEAITNVLYARSVDSVKQTKQEMAKTLFNQKQK